MTDHDALRREIADIDDQLRTLRGETDAVAQQVGGEAVGAEDPEDVAAALTNAEETGALIDALQARRERLTAQLEGSGATHE